MTDTQSPNIRHEGPTGIIPKATTANLQKLKEYGVAIGLTLFALMSRFALDPFLGDHSPTFTFIIAVAVTTWYGGLGPSITALILGGLLSNWFFMPPRGSLTIIEGMHQVGSATYVAVTGVLVFFGQARRRARLRAEVVAQELGLEVKERKQAE